MRSRRRRPRGPRPPQAGLPNEGSAAIGSGPSQMQGPGQGQGQSQARRRRRRPRGGNRPLSNAAPQPYANSGGPAMQQRPPGPPRRRRTRTGPARGNGGDRRRGLEVLRDLQNVGVALDPTERFILEMPPGKGDPPYGDRITGRAIDLVAPIGRGQRCLIVSPPKAGKTRILQIIASSIAFNHPDAAVYALLVDERPEEVTDFKRNTPAQVIAASSDMTIEEHIETATYAMEVVAAQVLEGKDVVMLLDSITRLARAYNAGSEGSGRTMSGGLDSTAMQAPRQIFGAARKIEDGGSLTIIGTALIDTGSRMDEVIFEEFKGTGNSEIILDRKVADKRTFPAIDITKSGTRKEELLVDRATLSKMWVLRRILMPMGAVDAIEFLLDKLRTSKTNNDFFSSMNQ